MSLVRLTVMTTLTELKAGHVVKVDLNPSKGAEQFKERPCVVIEADISPLKLIIILPITDASGKTKGKLFVPIQDLKKAGLGKASVVDCYQIHAVDRQRIKENLGTIGEDILDNIKQRLAAVLDIGSEHLLDE
jgi:mRNA interferase MazF